MSTNYYFKVKEDVIDEVFQSLLRGRSFPESEIIDLKSFLRGQLTHHIGKRSGGWKPAFKKTEFYSSVDEIISFYEENNYMYYICDEYGRKLTIEDLKRELIDWNKDNAAYIRPDIEGVYFDKDGYQFHDYEFS